MIFYHTDSNSIWVEPTKNRTEGELILARNRALSCMRSCGLSPRHQVLDNKASTAYKQAILDSGMSYQLVPPDDHRRNVAKKAIQTWKDHFIAVLSSTADKFPLHLWCQLIPHMERQLNLLRSPHMPTSTDLTTTMHHPLFLSVWRPSCMTNPIDARPTLNTAPKDGSLARPLSTTGAGKYGLLPHVALALPQQCSSNTSTSPIHPYPRPTPSSLQQPILPASLSTMPKHSTLEPKTCKTFSACSNFSVTQPSNSCYHRHLPNQSLPTPHLQGCRHIHQSPLPVRLPPQAPLSLMTRTVMTKWCHFQGCRHAAPSPSYHAHNHNNNTSSQHS
eukprot:CCRYP_020037-RA/>CCRYP_020037-RA protein AED:0.43 eAED:0.43 QI:0/0/0/1/0/0/2/0/331